MKIKGTIPSGGSVQPTWHVETDQYGIMQGNAEYVLQGTGDWVTMSSLLPKPNSTHPYYENLVCYKTTTAYNAAGTWRVSCEYMGLDRTNTLTEGGRSSIAAQVKGGAQQEDIQSHPRFILMAGTQTTPLRNAWTDNDTQSGVFSGFPNNVDTRIAELQGVRSYLTPTLNVSGYFVTCNREDISRLSNSIGKTSANGMWSTIQLIPKNLFGQPDAEWLTEMVFVTTSKTAQGKDISTPENRTRTWMLTNVSSEEFGNAYWRINFECMLSGRRQWHDDKIANGKHSTYSVYKRDASGG